MNFACILGIVEILEPEATGIEGIAIFTCKTPTIYSWN